jgi:exopolysaccharide production protein ExoQ
LNGTSKPLWSLLRPYATLIPLLLFSARGYSFFDNAKNNNQTTELYGSMVSQPTSMRRYIELMIVYSVIALLLVPFYKRLAAISIRYWLIMSLPILALLSVIWTQNIKQTLIYGTCALLYTLFALYLAERYSPADLMRIFSVVGMMVATLCMVLIIFFPTIGIDHKGSGFTAWQGMFSQKNHMGIIMTYYLVTLAYLDTRTSWQAIRNRIFMAICILLIIMSLSRTGWLLAAACIAVMFYLNSANTFRSKDRLLLGIVAVSSAIAVGILGVVLAPEIAVLLGKDPTLTGRTVIWQTVIESAVKRPLLGFGYYAFWQGLKGESAIVLMKMGVVNLGNAENGPLQLSLELGLVGLGLYFCMLWRSTANLLLCLKNSNSRFIRWCSLVLFINFMGLFDGDKIMFPHTVEWVLFVAVYVCLDREARLIRVRQAVPQAPLSSLLRPQAAS